MNIKYIGYVENEMAASISSSELCRVCWAAEALIFEKMPPRCGLLNQFTRDSPAVPPRAHACEKAPRVPLPRHLLEQVLKLRMPVYRLSLHQVDSSDRFVRIDDFAKLSNSAETESVLTMPSLKAVNSLINR